jgi:hypothetical protein
VVAVCQRRDLSRLLDPLCFHRGDREPESAIVVEVGAIEAAIEQGRGEVDADPGPGAGGGRVDAQFGRAHERKQKQ